MWQHCTRVHRKKRRWSRWRHWQHCVVIMKKKEKLSMLVTSITFYPASHSHTPIRMEMRTLSRQRDALSPFYNADEHAISLEHLSLSLSPVSREVHIRWQRTACTNGVTGKAIYHSSCTQRIREREHRADEKNRTHRGRHSSREKWEWHLTSSVSCQHHHWDSRLTRSTPVSR